MNVGKCWLLAMTCGLISGWSGPGQAQEPPAANPYTVAVYWWPNFHCDAFHQSKKFPGWTEWEIVKHGTPRFPGHTQPKVPLWGYRDEADPKAAARSIDALADAGVGTVNSWNEWVEGSYLEPDTETGTKYLDAIREVFGPARLDKAFCPATSKSQKCREL